jgi:hypothetical protein
VSHPIRALALALAATLALSSLATHPSPAAADDASQESSAFDVTQAVGAVVGGAPITDESFDQGVQADVDGTAIDVSADSSEGASLDPDNGEEVTLGLPASAEATGTEVSGEVIFDTASPDADLAVRPTDQGVQALIAISGADAPTSYRFPVTIGGAPARLAHGPDGTIEAYAGSASEPAAVIQPAWATDADDAAVPTEYLIDGHTLVQVVDHRGAAYPVIADPSVSLGWKIYVKYNETQVKRIAANSVTRKVKYIAAICLAIPNPVAQFACGAYAYDSYDSVANTFESAAARKRCVEMSYSFSGYLVGWKTYSC